MNGTQPADLTTRMLIKMKLPLDWAAHERMLGV